MLPAHGWRARLDYVLIVPGMVSKWWTWVCTQLPPLGLRKLPGVLLGWPLVSILVYRLTWGLHNHGGEGLLSISFGPPPSHLEAAPRERILGRETICHLPLPGAAPACFSFLILILPWPIGPGLQPSKIGESCMALSRDRVITRKQRLAWVRLVTCYRR